MIALDALDALGLALTTHNHRWSERERDLYERALIHLTFADCTDFDSSASARCLPPKLSRTPQRESAQS